MTSKNDKQNAHNQQQVNTQLPQDTNTIEQIKSIGNLLVPITGLAYVSGFLALNFYLFSSYGIYELSFINSRYIYSGGIFLFFCLLSYRVAYFLYRELELKKTKFVWLVFWYMTFASSLNISVNFLISAIDTEKPRYIPLSIWFYAAILVVFLIIGYNDGITIFKRKFQRASFPFTLTILVGIICLLSGYAYLYIPYVPASLGGARPVPVKFIIEDENRKMVESIMSFNDEFTTRDVYLISEGSNSYLILVNTINGDWFPVEINKALVSGVIHPEKKKFLSVVISIVTTPTSTSTIVLPSPTALLTPRP